MELTRQERRLRWVLRVAAFAFTAETMVYLLPALIGSSRETWGELPFVINSFLKAGLIGGVCFVAAADVRRFDRLVSLVVVGLGLWVPGGLAILIFGDTSKQVELLGVELEMTLIIWLGIALEGALAVGFALLHRSAFRAWHGLEYLSAGQFRTLSAVAECLLWSSRGAPATRPPAELSPDEVAERADGYLRAFEARRKWVMKAALVGINLYPLLFVKPAFGLLGVDERREFLEKRFGDDVARRRIGSLRRWLVQGMIRLAQQVVYLGYYSDSRTWRDVGYRPFSKRPEGRDAIRKPRGGLRVISADSVGDLEAEVVIVGSGAAGSVIAHQLARDHEVLVLERGHHVDPADFSEDEVEMLTTLYRDGAVQMARDFKLQVLQGMCVGGTTVVNNAVSIPPPSEVLDGWERGLGDAFDRGRVERGVERIQNLLGIAEQPARVHSPGATKFIAGVEALGLTDDARRYGAIEANIHDCLGCGYCNIGCAFGRKLSMLDTLLPWTQQEYGSARLRILSEAHAEGFEIRGHRVEAVQCRSDGNRFRVRGRRFVLAAGAINSAYLLGRSGLGGSAVGRGLSFNVGSPVTAEFDEKLDSYAGLQITHVFEPPSGGPDVVMETWFNPVVSQSIAMPGWFEDHRRNMLAYDRLAATGVLIGTDANGRVAKALFGGADIVYRPTEADLRRLVDGIKLACRIYLAADARRVMPSTFQFHAFTDERQLDSLDEIVRDNEDIQLGTGHPQGGNALGATPDAGPVAPGDFRVHGTENLHCCDAGVFPTSLGVNPQLTTMALADCAAERLSEALG
jgi:choline dehydrogenase-like flavoprotein